MWSIVPWNKPSHLKDCTSASGFSLIQVTTAIITPTYHARYIIYIVYVFYVAPPSVDTYHNLCARAKVKGHIKLKIEENTSVGKLVKPFQI